MKRILSGILILLFSALCAGFSDEAVKGAEAVYTGEEELTASVSAAPAAAAGKDADDAAGKNAAEAEAEAEAVPAADVAIDTEDAKSTEGTEGVESTKSAEGAEKKYSLVPVVIQSGAATEEQALVLAEKKAVAHFIQTFQEENTNREYAAGVFTLADEYEKFVIAANVLTREITADGVLLKTRIDIAGNDLMAAMAEYEVKSDKPEAHNNAKKAAR